MKEDRPPSIRKKNRRQWCRGKKGVEHQPVCVDAAPSLWTMMSTGQTINLHKGWKELRCSVCAKVLETWMPPSDVKLSNGEPFPWPPKPDWVRD